MYFTDITSGSTGGNSLLISNVSAITFSRDSISTGIRVAGVLKSDPYHCVASFASISPRSPAPGAYRGKDIVVVALPRNIHVASQIQFLAIIVNCPNFSLSMSFNDSPNPRFQFSIGVVISKNEFPCMGRGIAGLVISRCPCAVFPYWN